MENNSTNLLGIKGIKTKIFKCTGGSLHDDEKLNEFIASHDGNIIDIKFSGNGEFRWVAMVIYK